MIPRIVIGVLLAYLLIAYYPLVLQGLPYFVMLALGVAAFWCLRAAPELAEPLGYGILIVLLCYMVFLFLRRKDKLKELVQNARQKKIQLPVAEIPQHPQLSVILTLVLYTLGLTFVLYLIILLIYVK
ncbi:MAG: hypothetical protein IKR92_00245 [Alphaproteobacteria bacterium]|nr:hypothetical protein [Alphaproteobacteria bacterium]